MNILKNRSFKTYERLSRYASFPIYYNTLDNKYVCGTISQLNDTTPFTTHVINNFETLDDIALQYYGNPTYYWVIADFNHIQDPYGFLNAGKSIKIPVLSNIEFL